MDNTIPKIIHQVWIGGPIPDHIKAYTETWDQAGWEHRIWGEEVHDWIELTRKQWVNIADYIIPETIPQALSDLFRYEVLFREGGVYADADFELLRPIDDLVKVKFFTAWETDNVWANMAISGLVKDHPFVEQLINGLDFNFRRFYQRRASSSPPLSGPRYLTPFLKQRLRRVGDIAVYPQRFFYPYLWNELEDSDRDPGEAYARHHWNHMRSLRD